MSSAHTSQVNNTDMPVSWQARPTDVPLLEMLLPPQAVPLVLLLLVVAPIVLLTGESLFIPLFAALKAMFLTKPGEPIMDQVPSYFYFKLLTFLILSFLGGFQLLMRIKTIYFCTWARTFPRPHPLHVDYRSDSDLGMAALLQWKIYQIAAITLPPIGMALVTGLVGMLELYLFNTLSGLTFPLQAIQITIELFVIMMLGLFTVFAFFNSLWTALTSLFGDVIAVTEPDLPTSIIMQRCGRIAFASPRVYVLFPAYLIMLLIVLAEIAWLLTAVDIHELVDVVGYLKAHSAPEYLTMAGGILAMSCVTLAAYMVFNWFKFCTYHHGLSLYYDKLPAQLKECFSPPSAMG